MSTSLAGILARTRAKISTVSVMRFTGRKFERCIRMGSPAGAHLARCAGFGWRGYRVRLTKVGKASVGRPKAKFFRGWVQGYCEEGGTPCACSKGEFGI